MDNFSFHPLIGDSPTDKLKGNKDCQVLLFDVHVVHRIPKWRFSWRISEDNGQQVVSMIYSNMQYLYSIHKTIALCRYCRRPCILKRTSAVQQY